MSAVCFLAAFIVAGLSALGVGIHSALFWVLTLIAAGLLLWSVGAPGWTWPARRA